MSVDLPPTAGATYPSPCMVTAIRVRTPAGFNESPGGPGTGQMVPPAAQSGDLASSEVMRGTPPRRHEKEDKPFFVIVAYPLMS